MVGKICAAPGCQLLARDGTRCARHSAEREDGKRQARRKFDRMRADDPGRKLLNTAAWKRASRAYRTAHPMCECGCGRFSEVVDHIKPHRGDPALFWDQGNWQALAEVCHNRKTATEDGGFTGRSE